MTTPDATTPGIFAELSAEELAELDPLFEVRRFPSGELLFRQGEPSDGACIVDAGEVDLELMLPGGEVESVYTVHPGQLLGEPALLQSAVRQLSARARGDVTVRYVEQIDFQALRNSFRPVAFKVIRAIARLTGRRLQRADELDSDLTGGYPEELDPAAAALGDDTRGASFDPLPFMPLLPLFRDFSRSDLAALAAMSTFHEVPRGRDIVRFGQTSDRCWVVIRGAVEALNPKGGRRVALLGPGKMFGQLAPLLGSRTIATCRVREDAVLLEIGAEAMNTLLEPDQRVSFRFINALALDLLSGLARANRVLARSRKMQRMSVA